MGFDTENMIRSINMHVPATRRSLLECLEGNRTYRTRDGAECEMDPEEIEFLSSQCTEIEKMQLRLPIFVSTDISGDMPAWKVDGKVESKIVARILGRTQFREDSVRFYHPDYQRLVRKLPTTVTVLYLP